MKIFLAILIVVLSFILLSYNRLIGLIEAIRNNEKQIDIQLDRRFKVFESLIQVVQKYMDFEKTTLKDVVSLRNQAQMAKNQGQQQQRIAAEEQISKIAANINLVFEQYPDLKANQNTMQLQEEIVSTENKLAYSKQALNDSIERYNADKKSLLTSVVVSIFNKKLDINFSYWQLADTDRQTKENYTVKL